MPIVVRAFMAVPLQQQAQFPLMEMMPLPYTILQLACTQILWVILAKILEVNGPRELMEREMRH